MNERDLAVLEQYELTVRETYRGRDSYVCITDKGKKLLLEYRGSERKAKLQQQLLSQIAEGGYRNVDIPVTNMEGNVVTKDKDGNRFILKDWFDGKPCDVCKEDQLKAAMENLAQIHKLMQGVGTPLLEQGPFDKEQREVRETVRNTDFAYTAAKHNKELKKVRAYVRNKKNKTDFELYFLQYFSMFYEKGLRVENQLSNSVYVDLHNQAVEKGHYRHGEYSQHNVLFTPEGIATVNFEQYIQDVQLGDVVYFLRKILEKYDWDEWLGFQLLEAYNKKKPLSKTEREYLALRLGYPEKFWKLSNRYYNMNKAWISGQNTSKLVRLVVQETAKEYFINKLAEK